MPRAQEARRRRAVAASAVFPAKGERDPCTAATARLLQAAHVRLAAPTRPHPTSVVATRQEPGRERGLLAARRERDRGAGHRRSAEVAARQTAEPGAGRRAVRRPDCRVLPAKEEVAAVERPARWRLRP